MFAEWDRHTLPLVGALYVYCLFVLIAVALCLLMSSTTPSFKHGGQIGPVLARVRSPIRAMVFYLALTFGIRGYNLLPSCTIAH
ncbi:hypothetical protein AMAG_19891 [Allomyces macrogynus ATCC 38327]|uniref:Uncharacterized protein n=1 Tax=Allomyces macrogynus (strain ATCC 38327) TaxID=578462 RepID=A0A0L0T3E2_ALLM3|nr:hypothetical protein AMAG_19891 [Allomyces macrogynus ATCC 38327]|eukprot:KNE69236.1 hypothetical protein AMAG_19891 [Allomyces macrogynus ATCC 38327]